MLKRIIIALVLVSAFVLGTSGMVAACSNGGGGDDDDGGGGGGCDCYFDDQSVDDGDWSSSFQAGTEENCEVSPS